VSGLFGKPANATQPQQLNSINVDRSRYGDPVPLVYGMQRIPITLLWYGDFTSTATHESGKGGSAPVSGYTYTASVVMGLCEGPISGIREVWKDKAITTLATEDLTLFEGAGGQAPWSYLSTNFPAQAVPYDHTAYLAEANLQLGNTAATPNYTFEVQGFFSDPGDAITLTSGPPAGATSTSFNDSPVPDGVWDITFSDFETRSATLVTVAGLTTATWDSDNGLTDGCTNAAFIGGYDAAPARILNDYCTDPNHGCGFSALSPYIGNVYNEFTCSYAEGKYIAQIEGDVYPLPRILPVGTGLVNETAFGAGVIDAYDWTTGTITMSTAASSSGSELMAFYASNYQAYCTANGIVISPWEDTQRPAAEFIKDILAITNSNCVMSAGVLNIYPYADAPVSGNGASYYPDLQPLFAFTDADYIQAETDSEITDPVVMTRKPLTETWNVLRIEFNDRSNNYNPSLAQWEDPLDIAVNGIRCDSNKSYHQITVASVALTSATLMGQRQLYIRNEFSFSVRNDVYTLLEPMDLVSLTDSIQPDGSGLGITNLLVRITKIEDDENDIFTITAEDTFVGTASAPLYNFESAQGYYANYAVLPPSVNTPVIFSAPAGLVGAGGGYQLWVAVGPAAPTGEQTNSYGGCNVFGSLDNLTFTPLGSVVGQARYGAIPSNVGAEDTSITVTLTAEGALDGLQLSSASASDYANNRALIYLDGEIIGFENADLVGTGEYTLSPVTRGLFGTGPSPGVGTTHTAGASWARLDTSIFKIPFDPGIIGQTMYLKFCSFNDVSVAIQPLSEAETYTYLVENYNVGQLLGGPLTLEGVGMGIAGTSVFKSATTTAWDSGVWSLQAYINGAFVAFQPNDATSSMMMGLHSAPGVVAYGDLDFMMYCGAGNLYFSEAWTGTWVDGSLGTTYAAGDALQVVYDGNIVRYMRNGALLRQVSPGSQLTLYLASSFNTPNAGISGIQFGGAGVSSPVLFNARGTCIVSDGNAFKLSAGANAWDSDVYSVNGYPTCHVVFKASQTSGSIMIGLVTQPAQSPTDAYEGLLYAIYLTPGGDLGDWELYESGAAVAGISGTYDETTLFAITYDGSNVVYEIGGTAVRTVSSITGKTFFVDSNFYSAGAGVNTLDFGPGALIPVTDTLQLGDNAATDTYFQTLATYPSLDTYGTTDFPFTQVIDALEVDCVLVVTAGGTAWTAQDEASSQFFYCALIDDTEYDDGFPDIDYIWTSPALTGNYYNPFTLELSLSLPAGTARTLYMAAATAGAGSCALKDLYFKVEVIKK
jgi:Putative phage tail protein